MEEYLQNSTKMNLLSVIADWKVSFSKTRTPWSFLMSSVLTKTANANSKRNFIVAIISRLDEWLFDNWRCSDLWRQKKFMTSQFDRLRLGIQLWVICMVHLSKGKRILKTDIVNWKLVPVPQEHVEIGRRSKTERDETRTLSSRYKG
jgi:hypothetical protein